jgi:type II secretory pathway component PulL
MKILNKIISNYHDVLTDDNIEEIAREIYSDYECEDEQLENINIYIEDLLSDLLQNK